MFPQAEALLGLLAVAQRRGFVGAGAVAPHLEHALVFRQALEEEGVPSKLLDLGSGAGLPGLVLAGVWPQCRICLLDSSARRSEFLRAAVEELGWGRRVRVLAQRAEEAGHAADLRGGFDVVTARGFAPPAVTAECAAGFLGAGGRLVVSEPPPSRVGRPGSGVGRWPPSGLAKLGMTPRPATGAHERVKVILQVSTCPSRFPRRTGVPKKRPLF